MELWDVYDRTGRRTGHLIERTTTLPQGQFHLAAELWLADRSGRLLIQRRSMQKQILPGAWTMTTGCMLAGEDSLPGVLRESCEELGISLTPQDLTLIRRITRSDVGTIWDVYAARLSADQPTLSLQSEEVDGARWIRPAEFRARLRAESIYFYPEVFEVLDAVERWLRSTDGCASREGRSTPAF